MKYIKLTFLFLCMVVFSGCAVNTKADICHSLSQDSLPAVVAPNVSDTFQPASIEEWVIENYKAAASWKTSALESQEISISLPAIQYNADFAVDYNQRITDWGNDLLTDINNAVLSSSTIMTKTVSYEASLHDGILYILLIEELNTGEYNYSTTAFDVETGTQLEIYDLCRRLLHVSYPTFLELSSNIVVKDFKDHYYNPAYGHRYEDEFDLLVGEEQARAKVYHSILNDIPSDSSNLYHRSLFMNAQGQVLLIFDAVLLSDNDCWLETTQRMAPIHLDEITYSSISEEAALVNVLSLPATVKADYYHAYLIAYSFMDNPAMFVSVFSSLEDSHRDYLIAVMKLQSLVHF